MPGQAGTRGATADQLIDHDGMKVMYSVSLYRRRVLPAEGERSQAAFHFPDRKSNLLLQTSRAEIAAPRRSMRRWLAELTIVAAGVAAVVALETRGLAAGQNELALAWGFVGIPLLWGVYGTVVNAMKLFQ